LSLVNRKRDNIKFNQFGRITTVIPSLALLIEHKLWRGRGGRQISKTLYLTL
jgi:hypothetical protein